MTQPLKPSEDISRGLVLNFPNFVPELSERIKENDIGYEVFVGPIKQDWKL